jgi:hypothetical protein
VDAFEESELAALQAALPPPPDPDNPYLAATPLAAAAAAARVRAAAARGGLPGQRPGPPRARARRGGSGGGEDGDSEAEGGLPLSETLMRRLLAFPLRFWFRRSGGGSGVGAAGGGTVGDGRAAAGGGRDGDGPQRGPGPLPLLTPEALAWINAAVGRLLRGCDRGNCSFNAAAAPDGARALGGLLQGGGGPVWNRALALGAEAQVCPAVERLLFAAGGAARIVVGHSVQPGGRARSRCGGRVLLLDTGMSSGMADAPAAGWLCRPARPPPPPPPPPEPALWEFKGDGGDAAWLDEEQDGGVGWRGAAAAVEAAEAEADAEARAAAGPPPAAVVDDGLGPRPGEEAASVVLYADGVRQRVG